MIEQFFTCPYCWEEQFKWVDGSVAEQEFIEDCEVCCNPIQFYAQAAYGEVQSFSAEAIGQ